MISIKNITKSFKGFEAVKELSIDISKGEIYGLLGSNGAGKSTTINILLGFLEPDSGEALVDNINVSLETQKARKDIGYIPENVNLYPYLTGVENLDYFCKLSGEKHSLKKLRSILIECGLDKTELNKKVGKYSKGMRQKVGIAIAYAKNAKVYLLDEPASGLDPFSSNQLSKILINLKQSGAAIFMASHDIFRVRETCDKIGILKNGKLIKEMYSKDVTSKQLENIYLEYMKK